MKLKNSIFCADDWGLSPGVNAGILELARNDLLSSVSCIANSAYLTQGLSELLSYKKNGLQFHLHFNLTYGSAGVSRSEVSSLTSKNGNFLDSKTLIFKSLTGQVSRQEVEKIFLHQLEILKQHNIPVTGLDGHHHVHLLPAVYLSIKHLLIPNQINTIRTMIDPEHRLSFLQSVYFTRFIFDSDPELVLKPCGYVLAKNLKSGEIIKEKMSRYSNMIVHPAKLDDFRLCGINDKLQAERLVELKLLMEYFS
ncbi:MAG: ChbG/HpnK family deacetylase [Bacteriovorax sp.]|jgi:predicted glycoside hydrolase/deacetylase ChbG (UPF0249 family)